MDQKQLFYFIAQCLVLDNHPEYRESIRNGLSSGEIIPEEFIRFCDEHLILPAIYLKLKNHGLLDLFPQELKIHISGIYLRNKKRNLNIINQIKEIDEILEVENIQPVYLKGAANLLDNVYPDTGERLIGDIDVLVQEKDFIRSAELLKKQRYRVDEKIYDDISRLKHYPRLFRPGVTVDIEIHRVPVDLEYSKKFNAGVVFEKKKSVNNLKNCFVPSDRHKVIHTFIHSQLSNYGYWLKRNSLRDLYDMYLLAKRVEMDTVIQQTEKKGKIKNYSLFTDHVFKPDSSIDTRNESAVKYIRRHDWFLTHPRSYLAFFILTRIYHVVFKWFIFRIPDVFFSGATRHGIIRRISDPKWFKRIYFDRTKGWFFKYIAKKR